MRVRAASCPVCEQTLDGASFVDGPAFVLPVARDLTVCLYCVAALEYADDLSLRVLNPRQLAALPAYARDALLRAQRLIRTVKMGAVNE